MSPSPEIFAFAIFLNRILWFAPKQTKLLNPFGSTEKLHQIRIKSGGICMRHLHPCCDKIMDFSKQRRFLSSLVVRLQKKRVSLLNMISVLFSAQQTETLSRFLFTTGHSKIKYTDLWYFSFQLAHNHPSEDGIITGTKGSSSFF